MNAPDAGNGLVPDWVPTRAAALARLAAVQPASYASTRNALEGAVTRLSPYITHGLLTLPELLADLAGRHPLEVQHKLVFELGWREYFRHVWAQRGDDILQSRHEGPLPDDAYATELPTDVRRAETGVPAIDQAVRMLYECGWLHNHARLWLASYLVHLRKVHWRTGADWMLGHLLDGDIASNHLSWQWVAGTGSGKPYLFTAEGVSRLASPDWHSPGTCIDTSLDALQVLATSRHAVGPERSTGTFVEALDEPDFVQAPAAEAGFSAPFGSAVAGRDVWLLHPWALRAPPADLPEGTVVVGLCLQDWHQAWPWTRQRWQFVSQAMATLTRERWFGTTHDAAEALRHARSVQTVSDPHLGPALARLAVRRQPPMLFAELDEPSPSFSHWWGRVTKGVASVHDLPGLAALRAGG